jgi:hypothetical protein
MNRVAAALGALMLCFLVGRMPLSATDKPEPLAIDDPLIAPWEHSGLGFMTAGHGEFAYNYNAFSWSATNIWNMHATVGFTPLRLDDAWALSAYYSAWTLATPYQPGEPASNVIHFWLGGLEFEYGLCMAFALGPLHLTAEYSRTSLHDLKGSYSEVSTDDLKLGLVWPGLELGPLRGTPWLRGGTVDLFDFWQSILPKPRLAAMCELGADLAWDAAPGFVVYDRGALDGNFPRAGGFDVSWWNELGIRLGSEAGRLEIYLGLSGSPDNEELRAGPLPDFLAGLGARLSFDPR